MTSRYSKRLRSIVSVGAALTLAAVGLAAPASAAEPITTDAATFTWAMNQETGAGAYDGSCNYLSAGVAGDAGSSRKWTDADYESGNFFRTSQGNVRVEKAGAEEGTWVAQTWAGRCKDGSGATVSPYMPGAPRTTNNRVVIENGSGTIDPAAGTAQIQWTGSFSPVFYDGLTYWTVTDPQLTVAGDGTGTVVATASGYAASMEGGGWSQVQPTTITLANFKNVEVSANGFSVTPDYLGVAVTGVGQTAPTEANAAVWGAFPQSFVDFQQATGQASYWYSSGSGGDSRKIASPISIGIGLPQITQQPADVAIEEGKRANFAVAAENPDSEEALTYVWESSSDGETWTAINGATQASYSVIGRVSASGTQYRVRVTNENGAVTSADAKLTVTAADLNPQISLSAAEFNSDGTATVTVTGTGFDPQYVLGTRPPLAGTSSGVYVAFGKFAEQWKASEGAGSAARPTADVKWAVLAQDFNSVGGAAGGAIELKPDGSFEATLKVSQAAAEKAAKLAPGKYGVYTYAGGGGWQPAFETFTPVSFSVPVYIDEQPVNRVVTPGSTALIDVSYGSQDPVAVQWQVSTDDGKTWSDIEGKTNARLELANVDSSLNANLYRAKFVADGTTSYSESALLAVRIPGLAIAKQPATAQTVAVGGNAELSVVASGQFVTYQWQVRTPGTTAWTDLKGATSQKLTVSATAVSQSGTAYRVVLANPAGQQISSTATIAVTKASAKLSGKVNKKKVKAGKRVKVTATLKTAAAKRGKVRVVLRGTKGKAKGKKIVRNVRVKANGKIAVTSPKLRKGNYRVNVRYLGTANIKVVKAKKIATVKVR